MDAHKLIHLIAGSENWLIQRVLAYAKRQQYTKYTFTLAEAWRASIVGMSNTLLKALALHADPPELHPDDDFANDPIAMFGRVEAQRHRQRGVPLSMFLGFLKYYRQSYLDLISESDLPRDYQSWSINFVNRVYDRVELGFITEWAEASKDGLVEELQAANRALSYEKTKYMTILESLANPLFILNENNDIEYMNHAGLMLFHESTIPGTYYYGTQPCGEAVSWLRPLVEAFLSQPAQETLFETSLETRDGEKHFEVQLKRMLDVSGKFTGVVATLSDISARKMVENQLKTSLYSMNQIIEFLPDPTFVIDNTGRVTAWNRAVAELTGVRAAEMIGKGNYEYAAPFYGERRPVLIDIALFGDESCADKYLSLTRLENGVLLSQSFHPLLKGGVFLSGAARVLYDTEGNPTGAIESVRDITQQKLAEKSLRESQRQLAQIIEFLPDATMVINAQGQIIAWNRAISELTGVRASDIMGRGNYEYAIPFYGYPRPVLIDLVINHDERVAGQYLYVKKEGDRLVSETYLEDFRGRGRTWFWNTAAPLYDDDGKVIGAIEAIRDITSLKLVEEERFELEKRLYQSQKLESLGIMAGGIAHNFNNLLQVILGNLELSLMELPSYSPSRSGLQRAYEAAERAARISSQMLAYTGHKMFIPTELDINELVKTNLVVQKSMASESIRVRLDLANLLPHVLGDENQINQVIANLTTNAIESIGTGVGEIRISTSLQDCNSEYLQANLLEEPAIPGFYVCLEVSDTGCGMDPNTLERLFEPFFTTKFTGRGLGLAAVYGIMTAHKGAVMVQSEIDAGTTFRALFPVTEEALHAFRERLSSTEAHAVTDSIPSKGLVLVVDDEEWIRDLTIKRLEHLGYEALEAEDGDQAVEIFRERWKEISCVLLDLTMPKKGGGQVFQEMRAISPGVKALLASGYHEEEALRRFGDTPPAGFIHKPHDLQTLEEKLEQVLRKI
ncbi:MAG: PAS domain-containing hybrid sensor histidine kinase/response regulator [Desulfomonilaceae bacterium]